MIFQHTYQWIFGVSPHTGKPKTMTSRLWQSDWYTWANGEAVRDGNPENDTRENCPLKYSSICRESNHRLVYAEGQRHAVQPGRTQKGIGHIQIATLYRYDVRTITPYELECEGFGGWKDYLALWCQMRDKPALKAEPGHVGWFDMPRCDTENWLQTRPRDNYLAVAIRFDPVT